MDVPEVNLIASSKGSLARRMWCARIAAVLLILHGVIEIAGLALIGSHPGALTAFGGLTGSLLEENIQTVALFGVLWGVARLAAAWGSWTLKKWAVALGIILSTITMIAAVTIIPAGFTDTLFSTPALILLLYTWFGNTEITEKN
ncbi:MAG: hypothetical protein EHM70_17175 [Chloroflexota bacterium]|nr:MAG: hypothetical protein EHM70_17175 [Chloroflexota bacterium]